MTRTNNGTAGQAAAASALPVMGDDVRWKYHRAGMIIAAYTFSRKRPMKPEMLEKMKQKTVVKAILICLGGGPNVAHDLRDLRVTHREEQGRRGYMLDSALVDCLEAVGGAQSPGGVMQRSPLHVNDEDVGHLYGLVAMVGFYFSHLEVRPTTVREEKRRRCYSILEALMSLDDAIPVKIATLDVIRLDDIRSENDRGKKFGQPGYPPPEWVDQYTCRGLLRMLIDELERIELLTAVDVKCALTLHNML